MAVDAASYALSNDFDDTYLPIRQKTAQAPLR